jgi:integrase
LGRLKSTYPELDATRPIKPEVAQDLINFAFYMKKNGLAENTIIPRIRALKQLARLTDLHDPEQVKQTITSQKWKSLSKRRYSETYTALLKYLGITWTKPRITIETRLPFIPTETEIDQLIASMGRRLATLLQTLKETGARISEAVKLKWTDLSPEQKTLNITPSKNSNPRLLHISDKLLNMINELPHTRETIFAQRIQGLRTSFNTQRKAAARKLQNPRIQRISFHTFRHWKGTMEYHKTKDIIHVKNVLGHKNISNTMIYINIEQAIFLEQTDEWTCKVAKDHIEATQLIEAGFQYILTTPDGLMIFKKRK